MNLGENIFRLRTQKNLSQGELADALEVSRQSVSKWENNSAVPELEKLMKMAQVFGVTIDALVSGETKETPASPQPPREEPRIIYIEKPTRPAVTPAQILGIILTACSLLALVLFACFGRRSDIEDAFLLCLPVTVCGILCMVTKRPLLWCGWGGCAIYWLFMFVLADHWESEVLVTMVGVLLVSAVLLYTIYLHRKGAIHLEPWEWAALALILAAMAAWLTVNLLPPPEGTVTITPAESLVGDYR